jgi:hypothetical protein
MASEPTTGVILQTATLLLPHSFLAGVAALVPVVSARWLQHPAALAIRSNAVSSRPPLAGAH